MQPKIRCHFHLFNVKTKIGKIWKLKVSIGGEIIDCSKAEKNKKLLWYLKAKGLPKNQTPQPSCECEISNKKHTCEIRKFKIILKMDKCYDMQEEGE